MKKYVALTLALTLLSLTAIIGITAEINSDSASVRYTEKVIIGDPSFADGVEVKALSHYKNHLVWESLCHVGGETESNFSFHYIKHYPNGKPQLEGFILHSDISFGFELNKPASEQVGISRVYKELYDSLDYDEQGEITIRLADYYDYYPISINVNLPTVSLHANSDRLSSTKNILLTDSDTNRVKAYDDICEFFKIPVLKDEYIDLHVSKHHGNTVGFGHGLSDKTSDEYGVNSKSAYTDKACYIAINNQTQKGNIVDLSSIPGGYGIYALPYEGAKLKTSELAMVYKLDEAVSVNYIAVSEDNSKLLLTLLKNGSSYFEVVDIATMTMLQSFKINDGSHYIVYPEDGFTVYEFEDHIAVIKEDDGVYSLAFLCDKHHGGQNIVDYFYFRTSTALGFDGERLIIVDNILTDSTWYDKCGFFVAVYTKDGLQYFGEYESSLDPNSKDSHYYNFACRPLENFEVEIK